MALGAELLGAQGREPTALAVDVPAGDAEEGRLVVQVAHVALLTFVARNCRRKGETKICINSLMLRDVMRVDAM